MGPLNYHHLHYFWTVANEGGIAAASRRLHVGRASISAQIKSLETSIGAALFERRGRHLDLTDTGALVLEYAETIFRTGEELRDVLGGHSPVRTRPLRVGVVDAMMKLVAFRSLEPLLELEEPVRIRCVEGSSSALFGQLAVHDLDLVLSDVPPPTGAGLRVHTRTIDDSTVSVFAVPKLKRRLARAFPDSLEDAPLLLPTKASALRRNVDSWMVERGIRPRLAATFDDSALLKVFAEAGHGGMVGPTSMAGEIKTRYGLHLVGELEGLRSHSYATLPARRYMHPALDALPAFQ
ncbi:Transcriptional activator protein NhaR [Planctomycetes bacterium Poly30]|uniref:Transcriptional activator protein NhaR n=1 Tax=Saltatorellus ferox TaxID=2528018 RepID=A0A518EMC3_9BACT|nr:Transcriptional activator protein NhaR [Planctomycetes bacterium Poly30]